MVVKAQFDKKLAKLQQFTRNTYTYCHVYFVEFYFTYL